MEEVQQDGLESKNFTQEECLRRLEADKRRMQEEFDMQRAKMKELFLLKEGELSRTRTENENLSREVKSIKTQLDDAKSQLLVADMELESNLATEKRKAAEEIASLQQLVTETVEESSSSRSYHDSEVRKLYSRIRQLEGENTDLKCEKQQSPHHAPQESSSLAPSVVLSAVTKKIVKKLGADAFTSQDDDHREDTELLRSLVGPLELEIKALKDKLRATDEQLQKCRQCSHNLELEQSLKCSDLSPIQHDGRSPMHAPASPSPAFETKALQPCDMCSNYEAQLVREQKQVSELESKVGLCEKSVERHKEELMKEIGFRKDMEEKWNEKKEEHKMQVAELTTRLESCDEDLKAVQEAFDHACGEMRHGLERMTKDREKVQQELLRLQKENDNLVGKYTAHSQELQSEIINLPDTVEELQELLLTTQQDLIIAKIGKEASEEDANSLRSEIMFLKDQISSDQEHARLVENTLIAEMNQIKDQKLVLEKERKTYFSHVEKMKAHEKQTAEKLLNAQAELADALKLKKKMEEKNMELKSSVQSLHQELGTSETVQKDFVKLSQNLQVELQKIRDADTQVRWQHDEDVDDCPLCRSAFNPAKRKEHCRHCGQIFCLPCLSHIVPSGPNQRPSRVCVVCHTLLVKSSAPYFSTEAPHSPD